MSRICAVAAALAATLCWAEVAKVAVVEGAATRTPKGGTASPLAKGAAVELGDVIDVKQGNLKLVLNDESVIMLAPGSQLEITEAEFEGQERRGFKAFLKAGSLWTKVKKALGGASYEVSTERAVAGVRGTVFRIDADKVVTAAKPPKARRASIVRIVEGVVAVKPTDAVIAVSGGKQAGVASKPRTQVPGPTEVSADEWEKKFVELQANQQLVVGIDLWDVAQFEEAARRDAFAKWIEKHQ
ncbi:MAG: FecR domain-containing protein [Myxococcaceae bacterium]|nr:FecR domain-containing protein [Myxococcaceae bacterium]MCA3013044.1 FecR domain-containing protein [Myxococcaceae bacterium]